MQDVGPIEEHQAAMMRALAAVLRAEDRVRRAKAELDAVAARLKPEMAAGEGELAAAWEAIRSLLAETGEVEVTLPGAANDYCVGWATPADSVRVADASAVPDEWVEVERKPRKREIAKLLKALRDSGRPMPNWAALERGEPKLTWKAVKKGRP